MPDGDLQKKKERFQKLLNRAAAQGKLTPDKIDELRPTLSKLGIDVPEPQAEGQLGEMQARVAEQGAKIDRFKEKVGQDMEEATSAGQGVTPESSRVMTFTEPIEVKAGVPEEEQEPLPSMMTVESSIRPPKSQPIPDVEAASPTLYPGDGAPEDVHYHVDPAPDRVIGILSARAEQADHETSAALEEQIRQIQEQGEGAEAYKRYADQTWNEVRSTFEERGRPVVRTSKAGWFEGEGPIERATTFGTKFTGEYGAPFLAGMDTALTFGVGKHVGPALAGMVGDEGTQGALEELEQRGTIPPGAERAEDIERNNMLMSTLGMLTGAMVPGGAVRLMERPISAAASRLAPAGSGVMRRLGVGAAAGATGAAGGTLAERGVEAAGDVMSGEQAPQAEGVAAETGLSVLPGAAFGMLPPALGAIGRKVTKATRARSKVGPAVRKFEEGGGKLRPGGPKPDPDTRAMMERADASKPAESALTIRSRETARRYARDLAKKENAFRKQAQAENQVLFTKHKDKQAPHGLLENVVKMALNTKIEGKPRYRGSSKAFRDAIDWAADIKLVPPGGTGPPGGMRLSYDDVEGTPLEALVLREYRKLPKPGKAKKGPGLVDEFGRPVGAEEAAEQAGTSIPVDRMEIAVVPQKLNAEQLERGMIKPLSDEMYANAAASKTGAGKADPDLGEFDRAVREAREQLFGDDYARVKRKHDMQRRQLNDAKRVMGLSKDTDMEMMEEGRLEATFAELANTVRKLGDEPFEEKYRILRDVFEDNPELLQQFQRQQMQNIYESLTERAQFSGGVSSGGGVGQMHTYATGGLGGALELRGAYPAAKAAQRAGDVPPALAGYMGNRQFRHMDDIASALGELGVDLGAGGAELAQIIDRYLSELEAKKRKGGQ